MYLEESEKHSTHLSEKNVVEPRPVFPDAQQAKRWDANVCRRERVYSPGNQATRQEHNSQIHLS